MIIMFTINIPEEQKNDMIEAFCAKYSYEPVLYDKEGVQYNNTETKEAFTKRMLLAYFTTVYIDYKSGLTAEAETKRKSASDDAELFTVE